MIVEHAQPHCASHEYFNGILDDKSRGVFHGRILVQPIAQKTDAKQTNKNLLLSDDAGADTKPQLEIYADDVKCTHGATIGQLNEESIFYLRSRGIAPETARAHVDPCLCGRNHRAHGHNPLCGDQPENCFSKMDGDTIKDASFVGSGCCISKASASLLTEHLKGKTGRGSMADLRPGP
jgi:hypothetical protein